MRLTADDGYRAQRSYSIASAPEDAELMITVEELVDGEVSPWMVEVAAEGDQFEVRGPFGGWFVWDAASAEPLLLIAGGSGLVPLMSMLRHRRNAGSAVARDAAALGPRGRRRALRARARDDRRRRWS